MRLFRTIRHSLLSEKKIKKYFFYAIGEIALVVIGILIALQINNWNDNRIKKKNEFSSCLNIKNLISDDKNLLQGNKDYNHHYIVQLEYAVKIIGENDKSQLDTLGVIATKLNKYSDFNQKSTYMRRLSIVGKFAACGY